MKKTFTDECNKGVTSCGGCAVPLTGNSSTSTIPGQTYVNDDYCDCDERCPRCGKRKKRKYDIYV